MQKPSLATKADRNSDRTSQKSQNPQKIISLSLCHCVSVTVSESLSLWVSKSLRKKQAVWCVMISVMWSSLRFFLWKKMVGQFQPQAKLEVKDLETWNIETNRTEVWAPIWDAFVIHHSSSGPLTEQIWHSLLGFGGIWEVQVQRALALCPSSGTWDNDLMNCGGTLTRKNHGK